VGRYGYHYHKFCAFIALKEKEQSNSGIYAAMAGLAMMSSSPASGIFYPEALDIGFKILEDPCVCPLRMFQCYHQLAGIQFIYG